MYKLRTSFGLIIMKVPKVRTRVEYGPLKVDKKILEQIESQENHRITRSMSKLKEKCNNVVIREVYRCMPLLGDEKINAPDWDVHVAKYEIKFVDEEKEQ